MSLRITAGCNTQAMNSWHTLTPLGCRLCGHADITVTFNSPAKLVVGRGIGGFRHGISRCYHQTNIKRIERGELLCVCLFFLYITCIHASARSNKCTGGCYIFDYFRHVSEVMAHIDVSTLRILSDIVVTCFQFSECI